MTIENDPKSKPESLDLEEILTGKMRERIFGLGVAAYRRRDREEARKQFLRSAQMGNPDAYFGLGIVVQQEGDIEEAKRLLRKAMEMGSKFAPTRLGSIEKQEGNYDEVKKLALKALSMGDRHGAQWLDPSLYIEE